MQVPLWRVNEIVLGNRVITFHMTLALAQGPSERFSFGFQADYDPEKAEQRLGSPLEQIQHVVA